ncbi:hypothetical protein PR048_003088 [Dryococelus australis]|uniref:Uncharacterized protein n=1 Tax=Dryococelus australis TaxID=614101 RepID=A0ABQ9ILZ6_9NEOP|nr:hypothetical protein PR048_003088 [Dryococelus australis]
MATNNLTYHQVKLQLSPASLPKEQHDTVFRNAIPQASQHGQFFPQGILQSSKRTDPAPSTAASNVGFSTAKTFSGVINFPLNYSCPRRPLVNGALLHCDNGRLNDSHSPSISSNTPSAAGLLTGRLRKGAIKVMQCAVLEDDSSSLAEAI